MSADKAAESASGKNEERIGGENTAASDAAPEPVLCLIADQRSTSVQSWPRIPVLVAASVAAD